MTDMLKDKRATRGLRMSSLVGKAADEDDTFWKHEVCIYLYCICICISIILMIIMIIMIDMG